jgi:hypothetical protein
MSTVIRFLESVGAAPALMPGQYASLVARLNVDEAEHNALIGRDAEALGELLGGRAVMCCVVFEPQRDPGQDPDQQSPGDGEEEPDSTPDDSKAG